MASDRESVAAEGGKGGFDLRVASVLGRRGFCSLVVVLLIVDYCQVFSEPSRAVNRSRTVSKHPRLPASPHHHNKDLRCACTTHHCVVAMGKDFCLTQYKCFTQFLDRGDGSDPITRGCISGDTPLLCENRLPASIAPHRWPRLICCDEMDFCNAEEQQLMVTDEIDVHPSHGTLKKYSNFSRVAIKVNQPETIGQDSLRERMFSLSLLLKRMNVKSSTPSADSDSSESKATARTSPNKAFSRSPVVICFVIGGLICLAAVFSLGFRALRTDGLTDVNGATLRKTVKNSTECDRKEEKSAEIQPLKVSDQCVCHG